MPFCNFIHFDVKIVMKSFLLFFNSILDKIDAYITSACTIELIFCYFQCTLYVDKVS